jgi:nucleotide-binding universal stress UspA family protein
VAIETELKVGSAAQVLLDRARAAAMVVVGARGARPIARWPLGSTARQVVTHTSVPAVVVREPERAERGEVAVGVDGSNANQPAVRFALEEAALRKARLRIVHAWSRGSSSGPDAVQPQDHDPVIFADEEWRSEFPEVEVLFELVRGRPARILAGASARSDLLVVGTRGRGGFPGLRLGSVSRATLNTAYCPVAVVPFVSRQERP